ncbi:MAG: inositol monophosphatase [bacterium]|nr:inositol monophosphatase [bacterium]
MRVPLEPLRDLAVRLATEAAAVHRAGLGRVLHVETKASPTDHVSEVDREAERVVVAGIAAARPDDGILGEEGTARPGTTGVRWIIDPLDGTTNYLYGFPAFSVSIGVEVDGQLAVGVVHDSARDRCYAGVRGGLATCDGRPIRVRRCADLGMALVGTGFQYRPAVRARQAATVAAVLPAVRDVRRGGSAALDLCWVAAGHLDAFYEAALAEWDVAAGMVIAAAAGAEVVRLEVADGPSPLVVAAHPDLMPALTALLRRTGAA